MESWLSGLKRTIGNRVSVMSASGVQIPNSPPPPAAEQNVSVAFLFYKYKRFYNIMLKRLLPPAAEQNVSVAFFVLLKSRHRLYVRDIKVMYEILNSHIAFCFAEFIFIR